MSVDLCTKLCKQRYLAIYCENIDDQVVLASDEGLNDLETFSTQYF